MTKVTPLVDLYYPATFAPNLPLLRYIEPYYRVAFMSAIFILIAFSLIVALLFLGAFFWSVRSGQYDDDHTPAMRMLFDDTKPQASQTKPTNQSSDIQSKSFNSES